MYRFEKILNLKRFKNSKINRRALLVMSISIRVIYIQLYNILDHKYIEVQIGNRKI